MALKKTEMESQREAYYACIGNARSALQAGLYDKAIAFATSSWAYIDGMMQFERKYEGKEFESVEGIDIVLEYAPLLFDFQSLDKLEELLQSQRRIDKHASDDLAEKLAEARELMWSAHRFWSHLETVSEARQDELPPVSSGIPSIWWPLSLKWEQMGIISRTLDGSQYRAAMVTRMDEAVKAKCPSCAAIGKARKGRFLEGVTCPKCQNTVVFVMLASESDTSK